MLLKYLFKRRYSVMDVAHDGYLCLLNDDGSTKEDLKLPEGIDDLELSA